MSGGRLEVVALDVNQTLSDLEPLRALLVQAGAEPGLLETWFASTLRDGFALDAAGTSAPFRQVAAGAMRVLLRPLSLTAALEDVVDGVLNAFSELPLHPDVEPGLRRLAEAGIRLVTLSNGSASVAQSLLERAGLLELVEQTLSVDDAGHWKPHPAAYAHAVQACGVVPEQVCLVACHPWDTDGARRAGLRSAWVQRGGGPYPEAMLEPDVTGEDLPAIAEQLLRPG